MSRQRWSSEGRVDSCSEQLRGRALGEEDAVVERREGERQCEEERLRLRLLCRPGLEEELSE